MNRRQIILELAHLRIQEGKAQRFNETRELRVIYELEKIYSDLLKRKPKGDCLNCLENHTQERSSFCSSECEWELAEENYGKEHPIERIHK